jgi:hypothetical protein
MCILCRAGHLISTALESWLLSHVSSPLNKAEFFESRIVIEHSFCSMSVSLGIVGCLSPGEGWVVVRGMDNEKDTVVPSHFAATVPPSASTSTRDRAKPSPEPCWPFWPDRICLKGRKSWSRSVCWMGGLRRRCCVRRLL